MRVTEPDLLDFRSAGREVALAGVCANVSVTVPLLASWLRGAGVAAITRNLAEGMLAEGLQALPRPEGLRPGVCAPRVTARRGRRGVRQRDGPGRIPDFPDDVSARARRLIRAAARPHVGFCREGPSHAADSTETVFSTFDVRRLTFDV